MGVLAPPAPPRRPSPERGLPFPDLMAEARDWCAGRSWIWRAPLVLYFAWSGLARLRDPLATDLFGGITLGVHELGHVGLAWAGRWPSIAGGSLAQVAAPVAAGWMLARQRDWFGITVATAWLASSLLDLAAYVGDARAMELPLVGLVPDPIHDWNWMLSRLGILSWDRGLAAGTRVASSLLWAAAVVSGAWLCREMAAVRPSGRVGPPAPGGKPAGAGERGRTTPGSRFRIMSVASAVEPERERERRTCFSSEWTEHSARGSRHTFARQEITRTGS